MDSSLSPAPSAGTPRPRRLVALVDCSAFYCSCERAFDPSLEGVPVAVLSNNDGCIIARSDEARALGVPMGAPFFKHRDALAAAGVRVFSSNYSLYGDMSQRVMAALESITPDVEPYSIDEAFLSVPTPAGSPETVCAEMEQRAAEIRERVRTWTGIPVRVSFAETKTLAKAASEWAKARLRAGADPCVCLWGHPDREAWLESMPARDVWGVGRRRAARLEALGVSTAADLAALSQRVLRSEFNVVLARTALELAGVTCISVDDAETPRQTLVKSRSFGEPVTDVAALHEAVATHAARAASILRREGLVAGRLGVFISTKGIGAAPHRSGGADESLVQATADTPTLLAAARRCLERAHVASDRRGQPFRYRKAGILLSKIRPVGTEQRGLFPIGQVRSSADRVRQAALMEALDAANRRFGKQAVAFAAMGSPEPLRHAGGGSAHPTSVGWEAPGGPEARPWEMRRERVSPRYATRWDELPVVRAI